MAGWRVIMARAAGKIKPGVTSFSVDVSDADSTGEILKAEETFKKEWTMYVAPGDNDKATLYFTKKK